jgi:hypothetical protein
MEALCYGFDEQKNPLEELKNLKQEVDLEAYI